MAKVIYLGHPLFDADFKVKRWKVNSRVNQNLYYNHCDFKFTILFGLARSGIPNNLKEVSIQDYKIILRIIYKSAILETRRNYR